MRSSPALLACLFWIGAAHATAIERPLPDATQEKTARALFTELRCVVCEGQAIADSDAPLAAQIRAHVRQLVSQGKSEREILNFFRAHYGEKIWMTPPVERSTALLWVAPVLLLGAGGVLVWRATSGSKEMTS